MKYDDIVRDKLRYYGINEIESRTPRYKTVDGIIYSADMTTLIACPPMKTGKVIIPEGVKESEKELSLVQKSAVLFSLTA